MELIRETGAIDTNGGRKSIEVDALGWFLDKTDQSMATNNGCSTPDYGGSAVVADRPPVGGSRMKRDDEPITSHHPWAGRSENHQASLIRKAGSASPVIDPHPEP